MTSQIVPLPVKKEICGIKITPSPRAGADFKRLRPDHAEVMGTGFGPLRYGSSANNITPGYDAQNEFSLAGAF